MYTVRFFDDTHKLLWEYHGINRIVYKNFGPTEFEVSVEGEDILNHSFPSRRLMTLFADNSTYSVGEKVYDIIEVEKE